VPHAANKGVKRDILLYVCYCIAASNCLIPNDISSTIASMSEIIIITMANSGVIMLTNIQRVIEKK